MASTESRPRLTDGISIGVLTRIFHRDLVDDVLRETGKAGQRTRLMPGRVTVYFVLAMCLFFDEAYEEVMRKLVNGLRVLRNWAPGWHVPTSSAMTQARSRLGPTPLAALFDRVAVPMARPGTVGAWFHGWRVMAVDGVMFNVPDNPDNLAAFGKLGTGPKRSPFPQVRLVGLGEAGTHAVVATAFDAGKTSERALIQRLIPAFEPGMLVLCDRGFYSYHLWQAATATGAALLWRLKNDLKIPVLATLPDGSYRSELLPRHLKANHSRNTRTRIPDEARIPVRVIEYSIPNRGGKVETVKIMTTILDPDIAPADELATLYAQRWEFELTLAEIETHQMSARMLRSRTPELVRQEIWALLLTHYAVRHFMLEAADDINNDDIVDVDRLSFIRSIRVIRRQVQNQAGFSPSPPDHGDQ